jgi:hypothetical protein
VQQAYPTLMSGRLSGRTSGSYSPADRPTRPLAGRADPDDGGRPAPGRALKFPSRCPPCAGLEGAPGPCGARHPGKIGELGRRLGSEFVERQPLWQALWPWSRALGNDRFARQDRRRPERRPQRGDGAVLAGFYRARLGGDASGRCRGDPARTSVEPSQAGRAWTTWTRIRAGSPSPCCSAGPSRGVRREDRNDGVCPHRGHRAVGWLKPSSSRPRRGGRIGHGQPSAAFPDAG